MTFIDALSSEVLDLLGAHTCPVRFAQNQCLMHEGEPGDGCYFIDEGSIRLELRDVEIDSERVLCHLEAGSVLGEFSLLDNQPRSASAYAQTAVKARWLSRSAFDELVTKNPAAGIAILHAMGRELSGKLRMQNRLLSEHLFAGEPDAVTNQMVAQASAAQKAFVDWPEERVDRLLEDIVGTVSASAEALAKANVEDSGIGVVADKIAKIRFACDAVYGILKGKIAHGPVSEDTARRVVEISSPMGVVLGIIPVTNPVSTIVFKTQICLKARNALILSCHRDAMRVGDMAGELIQTVLARHGAPVELVQWIKKRTDRRKTAMLMQHPGVAFILATGGPSIVEAAYSSGTPAIGVGAGNAPVLVCADADLDKTAALVVNGKSFDNGVICGSENNLVVVASVLPPFLSALASHRAKVVTADARHRLEATLFDETGHMRREMVGKSALHIARKCGLDCPELVRLLVVPVESEQMDGPFGHEKLAPVLSLFTVRDEEEGIATCRRILEQQGIGHTAAIHTRNEALARRFGREIPASRILVNVSAATGCIGIGTGLLPSFTLGCGTYGRNSTTDNVTYVHLMNIKRLAL